MTSAPFSDAARQKPDRVCSSDSDPINRLDVGCLMETLNADLQGLRR